ncbi:MAG: GAF domain-containing protein, partial [Cyanobacteria bacterium P01_H01_bin.121]
MQQNSTPASLATSAPSNGGTSVSSNGHGQHQTVLKHLQALQAELEQTEWTETGVLRSRLQSITRLVAGLSTANGVDPQRLRAVLSQLQQADDVLVAAVNLVQKLLVADRVLIYKFAALKGGTVEAEALVEGFTPALEAALPPLLFGFSTTQHSNGGLPSAIAVDSRKDQLLPYQAQLMQQYQVERSLAVPIMTTQGLWGFVVAHQCSGGSGNRTWGSAEVSVLQEICKEIATQLRVSQEQDRLRRLVDREKAVSKVVERIRQSLDAQAIFETTVREMRRYLGADRVGVFKFHPDNYDDGELVAEDVVSGYPVVMGVPIHDHCFGDKFAQLYREGRVHGIDDIENAGLDECYLQLLEQFEIKANLAAPLMLNDKLWGLLCVHQCSQPRHWSEDDQEFVKQVGLQFSLALQQSQSFEALELKNSQVQRLAEREQAVNKVANRIRQSFDLQNLFDTTVREIRRYLDTDRVGVYQFYEDSGFDDGRLVAEDVLGNYPKAIDVDVHDHCFGENFANLYLKGHVSAIDDVYNCGYDQCYIDTLSQFEVKANLVAPLTLEGKLWGLLCIHHCRAARHWEPEEIEFVQQVANQFSLALQQNQAFQELNQRNEKFKQLLEQQKAVGKIIDRIRQSVDLQSVFDTTVRELRRYLDTDRIGVYQFYDNSGFDDGRLVAEDVASGYSKALEVDVHDHCFGENFANLYLKGHVSAI